MLEYPLISTIQTLENEGKELPSLWLGSFFIIFKKYKSFCQCFINLQLNNKIIQNNDINTTIYNFILYTLIYFSEK